MKSFLIRSIVLAFTVLVAVTDSQATTYHVSPFGSNTPPYDTYAKAANHTSDAVAAASGPGDTVLVHAGTYEIPISTILLPSGLTLLGVDRDSVRFNGVSSAQPLPTWIVALTGDNEVAGLSIGGLGGLGVYMAGGNGYAKIHNCIFDETGAYPLSNGLRDIYNNIFILYQNSGCASLATDGGDFLIHDNRFLVKSRLGAGGSRGIYADGSSRLTIERNVFDFSISTSQGYPILVDGHFRPVRVANNLFIGGKASVLWQYTPGAIENNTVIGPNSTTPFQGIGFFQRAGQSLVIRNNAFFNLGVQVLLGNDCGQPCPTGGPFALNYNSYWPPVDSFYRIINSDRVWLGDTANFAGFPMFVDDSLYHLQLGSPLIDAGDPAILDTDGSRSDVGWTGGPGGVVHEYLDLPPLPPDSLSISGVDTVITVSWSARAEADLAGYRLYRGYTSGFWESGLEPLAQFVQTDTNTILQLSRIPNTSYYVVTAFDQSGQEGTPSTEVAWSISPEPVNTPPEWTEIAPQEIAETETLDLRVLAFDVDGDSLTLTAISLPMNSSFIDSANGTGLLQFAPDTNQAGEYSISLMATDGAMSDTTQAFIVVRDSVAQQNSPPRWEPIVAQEISEADTLRLPVMASDPDGDSLTLTAGALPTNASFVDSASGRGLMIFIPDTTQAGTYPIELIASDGDFAVRVTFTVTVNDFEQSTKSGPGIQMVYPNPASDLITVRLFVPAAEGEAAMVKLILHDILGRTLATCFEESLPRGTHQVQFNLDDSSFPVNLSSGVYLLRMQAGEKAVGEFAKIALTR